MGMYEIITNGHRDPHRTQEWLLTNGLGGFAFSTVTGCNSRRYHGLLVAATHPPVGRLNLVNRIGEMVIIDGKTDSPHEFSSNRFGDTHHPRGEQYLQKFELDHTAKWFYTVDGIQIEKEVLLAWKKNITAVRYTVHAGERSVRLILSPFVSMRDFHALRQHGALYHVEPNHKQAKVSVGELNCYLASDSAAFARDGNWWYGHTYAIETERGQDDKEDLFSPGKFTIEQSGTFSTTIWLSAGPLDELDFEKTRRERAAAVDATCATFTGKSETLRKLARAANDFVVDRKAPDGTPGSTVIAGYPWFADWGRDTMISLPGLFISTRRFAEAKQVLSVFAQYVSQGMIPNRFDDYTNEPSYNTVDASLWFIHACYEYRNASKDNATFERVLLPACKAIIQGYRDGTRFHIKMDPADCLITQGDEHTQLTWMDAKCDGIAFTPRQGKAVEINALWYHALCLLGEKELSAKVKESFNGAFWTGPFRGLCDVVDNGKRDQSIRPNQIFAVSLANSPLNREQQLAVVEIVRRELLTPAGLRTLSPTDANFHPRYAGPQRVRDEAYHNGTIWAWLIGAFLEAYVKVNDKSADSIKQAREWLTPLVERMNYDTCIGSISEIFEATSPYRSVGCCAQAWSVAEVLRMAIELEM